MNESRRQSLFMIGVALFILAGIMIYVSLTSPRVYSDNRFNSVKDTTSTYTADIIDFSSDKDVQFPVNINTATIDELMEIDGIGEQRARRIIAYREHIGGYSSVSQIKDIKGIGDSLYSKVAPYLTV